MKYLQRYLSLLLCLAMSLVVFSNPVHADALNFDNVHAYFHGGVAGFDVNNPTSDKITTITFDNGASGVTSVLTSSAYPLDSSTYSGSFTLTISNADNSNLLNSGESITLRTDNIYATFLITGNSINRVMYQPNKYYYTIRYADGVTSDYLTDGLTMTYNANKQTFMYTLDIEPSKDVQKITFYSIFLPNLDNNFVSADGYSCQVGITFGALESYPLSVNVEEKDDTKGLLASIIAWFEELWVTCSAGFANIVQGLTDLPGKIWGFFESGLKNLFVPDDAYIVSYKTKWTDFLSDRLGAVWDVVEITFASWERIGVADQQNTIEMPAVTIPLPGGNSFSFGGYDVKVVPTGFEFLATSLKLITSIACSILFINGLRKRYDEVVGVEQ